MSGIGNLAEKHFDNEYQIKTVNKTEKQQDSVNLKHDVINFK